ncbi:MAG TPA: BlaI/MecI/CopY family transcriptional regulator [Phycisphaerae bacterium]|jgi:predicted transcriptional regulator|nr:BlaI/MecI/CopY family transcriptional regulator [Phycisphaerae bacterium]HPM22440.1 BlaI/MecI/CopY family transcriptional regulator [Phycisphaerae bacterium]HQL54067.1 BlaI/MecI/CopY family transcriptional regulator [Phycisphaerae bacterium]
MTAREYELGTAELEVLKVLWDEGPGSVRDVLETLHARSRMVAYTTVQTMLTRLAQKGFVRADKSGAAFVYRATITRAEISQSRLRQLLDQLYDGAAGQLVLQLLKTERLKPGEIEELQKLIERLDAKRK